MKKFTLKFAMLVAGLAAMDRRMPSGKIVVLGNAAPPPAPGQLNPLPAQAGQPSAAEVELTARKELDKSVSEMVAAGLTHEQATAAHGHKKAFTKRFAEVFPAKK